MAHQKENRMQAMMRKRQERDQDKEKTPADEGAEVAKQIVTEEKLVKQLGSRISVRNHQRLKMYSVQNDISMSAVVNKILNEFFKGKESV